VTDVQRYQEITDGLAAETAAAVLMVYGSWRTAQVGPNALVAAIASVIATANAAATTLADLFVTAQIERRTGRPQPPTGIAPRDDTPRLRKAVQSILDDDPDIRPEPVAAPEPVAQVQPDPAPEPVAQVQPDPAPEPVAQVQPDPAPEPVAAVHPEPAPEPVVEAAPDETANRLERLARSEPLDTGQAITVEIINRIPHAEGYIRKLDADPCERCIRWAEDGRVFPKGHHFKRHLQCNCQPEVVVDNRERIEI
jgi:hypothetical protein